METILVYYPYFYYNNTFIFDGLHLLFNYQVSKFLIKRLLTGKFVIFITDLQIRHV